MKNSKALNETSFSPGRLDVYIIVSLPKVHNQKNLRPEDWHQLDYNLAFKKLWIQERVICMFMKWNFRGKCVELTWTKLRETLTKWLGVSIKWTFHFRYAYIFLVLPPILILACQVAIGKQRDNHLILSNVLRMCNISQDPTSRSHVIKFDRIWWLREISHFSP